MNERELTGPAVANILRFIKHNPVELVDPIQPTVVRLIKHLTST
jgi:hypothetical protein